MDLSKFLFPSRVSDEAGPVGSDASWRKEAEIECGYEVRAVRFWSQEAVAGPLESRSER